MAENTPNLYFRIRENGAAVFSVDTGNRNRRTELTQVASINLRSGEVRPHGGHILSAEDLAAINCWMDERREVLDQRTLDDILRTVDHLNLTATWAQKHATPNELERVTDALLMAMHDLRTVLVRKASDRGPEDL